MKDSIYYFLQKIKNFFITNEKELIMVPVIYALSFVAFFIILNTYVSSASILGIYLFISIFSYLFTLILLYILSKRLRKFLDSRPTLISILSLFLPLLAFSFQFVSDSLSKTIAAENAIKQSNNTNYVIINKLQGEMGEGAINSPLFQLDSSIYQRYWEYIQHNYSMLCRDEYIRTIISIDQFNLINKQRQELEIAKIQSTTKKQDEAYLRLENTYSKSLLTFASTTRLSIDFVINNCQDLKQSLNRNKRPESK